MMMMMMMMMMMDVVGNTQQHSVAEQQLKFIMSTTVTRDVYLTANIIGL